MHKFLYQFIIHPNNLGSSSILIFIKKFMTKLSRQAIILIALCVLFAAPSLLAFVFYQHPTWLGFSKTNRGVLVNPPGLLKSMNKSKQWRLLLWSPVGCDSLCMKHLDELARVRLALGRRLYHVDNYLLLGVQSSELSSANTKVLQDLDTHVLILSAGEKDDAGILGQAPTIYIVSPDNYAILRYTLDNQPDDIFHDIKQLVTD